MNSEKKASQERNTNPAEQPDTRINNVENSDDGTDFDSDPVIFTYYVASPVMWRSALSSLEFFNPAPHNYYSFYNSKATTPKEACLCSNDSIKNQPP